MNIDGEKLNNADGSQEQPAEKQQPVVPNPSSATDSQAESPAEPVPQQSSAQVVSEDKNLEEVNSSEPEQAEAKEEPVASEPSEPGQAEVKEESVASEPSEPGQAEAKEEPVASEPSEPEQAEAKEEPVVSEPSEPSKEDVVDAVKPEEPKGDFRWYVIQTFTGKEDVVKQGIEQTIGLYPALKAKVAQVLVPTEEIVEIKAGKRVEKIKKMFPGYVFLEMVLDEESWYLIRQTAGVSRFIGTKVQPTPVSEKEMQRVLKQLGKEERLEITFEKGEGVRVISGPFRGYTGTVDEVNAEKGKLKVLINIFGRDTPVEVNFEHAQKIV